MARMAALHKEKRRKRQCEHCNAVRSAGARDKQSLYRDSLQTSVQLSCLRDEVLPQRRSILQQYKSAGGEVSECPAAKALEGAPRGLAESASSNLERAEAATKPREKERAREGAQGRGERAR